MQDDEVQEDTHASGVPATTVPVAEFAVGGTTLDHVTVGISYGIIERFSEGLYSSPNKTFEELVTNSYDAGATNVWVYVPEDLSDVSSSIVVVDDGESMDMQGLKDLWRIGESRKRIDGTPVVGKRNPVGKFGIGKLATYVLATELTYIVHRDDHYLAVTMDYGKIAAGSTGLLHEVGLQLEVNSLTREQALLALEKALSTMPGKKSVHARFSSTEEPPHWTAAVMTHLKSTAAGIQQGRLKWVLRTALPLNPSFILFYNDERLTSSKTSGKESWSFVCGENEDTLPTGDDKPWRAGSATQAVNDEGVAVPAFQLPRAGVVWGRAVLYESPLERGKSEDRARSHGFFVRVRGRLINLDSPEFEIGVELRHGTLTRFHMEINADDLDDYVASPRESIKDSPALRELKEYLLAIFNRARNVVIVSDQSDHMQFLTSDGRISDPPPALSQGPLRRMVQRAVSGDNPAQETLGFNSTDIQAAEELLQSGANLVSGVVLDDLGDRNRLVAYSPSRKAAVVNQAHPFVNNYLGSRQNNEALQLLGLTELLTEAYLLDEDVSSEVVHRVMRRRDQFLRAIAQRHPRSAHVVANYLRESANDEAHLEDAVGDALELLGFEVRRLGGANHGTDGIATSRLGRRGSRSSDSYAFTYDAKSSGKGAYDALADTPHATTSARIRADTARTSILRVHREKATNEYNLDVPPEFTLLVAPGFQGGDGTEGLINDVCRNDSITAITVENFARVVELFPLQGLNPYDLRKLLDCKTPADTEAWVERQSAEARTPRPPVQKIVEILMRYSETKSATNVSHLSAYLNTEGCDLDDTEVAALVQGLQSLAPKSIYTDGTAIALNTSPAALLREVHETLMEYDQDLVGQYLATIPEQSEDE